MRKFHISVFLLTLGMGSIILPSPEPAQARCKQWTTSHNGTDLFYRTGTEGTVKNKLYWEVEQWSKQKKIKRTRVGKIKITCGKWFMKYLLPHRQCIARARVCY